MNRRNFLRISTAPQPAADERVAEHMRTVRSMLVKHEKNLSTPAYHEWERSKESSEFCNAMNEVESSARALLAAGLQAKAQP